MVGARPLTALPAEPYPAIRRRLQGELTRRRWDHSLSAARLAARLAVTAGVAPERAYLAGLLHDCGRDLPLEKLRSLLHRYRGRHADRFIRAHPALWHDPIGAYLARWRYGVRDGGVLRAIARHSIGGPKMHALDKLIYVADYCEPLRRFHGASGIRTLAQRDLDAAVRVVARSKIAYLQEHQLVTPPQTSAFLRSLRSKKPKIKG